MEEGSVQRRSSRLLERMLNCSSISLMASSDKPVAHAHLLLENGGELARVRLKLICLHRWTAAGGRFARRAH